uniref:Helicase ATP-binding domain-containing protein n=1 Tax=Meloidogyne hapla TaxID=6305 RepID=A0A1I8AZT5_MELHA
MGDNKIPETKSQVSEALLRNLFFDALSFRNVAELDESSIPPFLESSGLQSLIADVWRHFVPSSSRAEQLSEPSTSNAVNEEQAIFKPIQIFIDANNVVDVDQPSTSSSLDSSQMDSLQDAKVYERIRELREAGLWESTRLPKCMDPPRRKTHWDFFMEEVLWLANDFSNERKFKRRLASKFASNAKASWRKLRELKREKTTAQFARDEREAKRICGSIAKMIREFWQNVDKVVDFRANEIVEFKKRRALDQHLNFLVGAADKITSLIHENYATQSNGCSSSVLSKSSEDFEMDSESDDNESTLDVEEANGTKGSVEEELNELSKEKDMDMDQLLTSLPEGYLESLGYSAPQKDVQDSPDVDESLNDEQTRTTADLEQDEESANFNEKPDLRNVDYNKLNSENSEVRRQQLDNIAEAALEFQPRGYTLETTEVKTEVPFLLTGQLREYQLVGLDWLVTLYEKNLNGILADEMGLGKTIQTIALLAHLACARAVWGPHLIIVPTSVLLNWEMELKKWCPSLKVLNYFGSAKERAEKRKGWSKSNAFHICITSYKLVTQDIRAFKKKAWQYLILDEAQNIKNFRSQRWQLLIGLRSRRRLLLTGTPLQNSLMELWALLHFLMPNVFASHDDFREWFHCPITGMVEGTTEIDQALVQRLHKILRPFILRRLKSEVEKQLPTKTERVLLCHLSKRQRYLYNEFLSKSSTVENLKSGSMFSVLGVIMQLRKCCNHPNLFEPRPVVSPLVIQPISPQFSSRIFSINQKFDASTLCYGYSFSSDFVWKTFRELLLNENLGNNANQGVESKLPLINGLKFVVDQNGGHFYRPKALQQQKDDETMCNGLEDNSNHPTEFVNNTRKRKIPSQEATSTSELKMKSTNDSKKLPNFLKSPSCRLDALIQKKDYENKRIGIWLSTSLKQFSKPLLSTELMNFCRIIPNNSQLEEPLTTKRMEIRRSTGQSLIDAINERIGQNVLDWIENSLNSFLICVQRLLVEKCFEPSHRITLQQENLRQLTHNIYSSQISLAHKAELAAKLEFPELRLIEYDCGKLQVLARLLEQLYENKHRCLIFTQMSKMLDILQAFLSHHNYNYFRLDGSTHIDQRQAMMERFNTDSSIFCFILSTRSGGIGVNLTGADTVIFYDSDWNPIGQTRNVTIYRLISERTIEENILTKSTQKRRLGEMTIDEGEFTPDFFKSTNNLRELFNNEETVANILDDVIINQKLPSKELEMAMLSVEDKQDVMAAQKAKEENVVDLIEFDENTNNNGRGERGNSSYIESPSEQYLELINELKPIERYAVNFLTNENRPALDKEFEETEALIRAKQKEFLQSDDYLSDSDKGSDSKKSSKNEQQKRLKNGSNNGKTIIEENIAYDANLNEVKEKGGGGINKKINSLKNKKIGKEKESIKIVKRYNTRNSSLNSTTTTSQSFDFAIPQLPQTSSNGFGNNKSSRKKGS